MLRAAIIGCGRIAGGYDEATTPEQANTHVRAYAANPNTALVAVADTDAVRAERFAKRWGVGRWYGAASDLLAETQPDLVSVCTPDETHLELLRLSLDHGARGVWCEKPLGADANEAARVVEEFERRAVPLVVSYLRRWDPALAEAGARIRSGGIGRVRRATVLYGKGWLHNGSHYLDLLLSWLGPVERIENARPGAAAYRDDPTLDVTMRFRSGARVCFLGMDYRDYAIAEIDILGSSGRVRLTDGASVAATYRIDTRSGIGRVMGPVETRTRARLDRVMPRVLDNLTGAVRRGQELVCSGRDALETLRVAVAAIEAANAGRTEQGRSQCRC